ncbi:MAG TPA: hypothetical protein EYN69_10955, partial [Flavobacteriales bacterium]|nr:hypothetical protein [Flavobacteriales bacterium]
MLQKTLTNGVFTKKFYVFADDTATLAVEKNYSYNYLNGIYRAYYPDGKNSSLRLPPEGILMLDRITLVDKRGGSSGLGFIEAEQDLHPDD